MPVISEPQPGGAAGWKGLRTSAVGVVVSPRATYATVVARPRALGALLLAVTLSAGALGLFLSTERGRTLFVDRQMTTAESFGFFVSDAALQWMETPAARLLYLSGQIVLIPLTTLAVAALGMAIWKTPGLAVTFKQTFAVVAHSQLVAALATLVVVPLNYARETMSNPANLSALVPVLDDRSFAACLFGSIDLFSVWWIVNLAIGLSVLFKRGTSRIAWVMLGAYAAIAAGVAAAMAVFSGA
jgi:Yip1-like protein